MKFDEHWSDLFQLSKLVSLARQATRITGEAIEIGVWQGMSAIPVANAIMPATLHVVDHWEGSSDIDPVLSARDNFSIFLHNVEEGAQGNICIHKQSWREFASQWTRPVAFLYIDAEHTAEEVGDTIGAFLPMAVPGAVFAGDDYNWPGVQEGVHRHFKPQYDRKLWWKVIGDPSDNQEHPHPRD